MHDLPQHHSLGTEFFRFSGFHHLSADDYFRCLILLRPLFKDTAFTASTPGFYINWITNSSDDGWNSLRLSYYTTNLVDSLKAIQDFSARSGSIAIFASKETIRPNSGSPLDTYDADELRFRNFLNRNTQICLEVLEGYGKHSFQELVTQYRYDSLPQRIPPELVFGPVFDHHSGFFRMLKEISMDGQYWRDLVHPHLGKHFGLHFMVNMMAVPESDYHPWFWRDDWVLKAG